MTTPLNYVTGVPASEPASEPQLLPFINVGNLEKLPDDTTAPPPGPDQFDAVRAAGFVGIQGGDPEAAQRAGLMYATSGGFRELGDIDQQAARAKAQGSVAHTLHVGRGFEDDAWIDEACAEIVAAQTKHQILLPVETHRSTITQDNWRTVQILERYPGLRINADYSHWYTGLEMPYAGVDNVNDFIAPVYDRVSFMHGRIGNSGCIQIDAGRDLEHALTLGHVQHFVTLWTATFAAFKRNAAPGQALPFAPELLEPSINYARLFPQPDGSFREESDRWQQALLYIQIAQHCFDQA